MKTRIDREHWERKEYFDFFGSFGEPFWGINFSVDISGVREFAADSRISLFTSLLYGIMKAANAQENFRYRIEENDIVLYDRIHPSFTVAREDRSFCFAFTEYTENFQVFAENLAKEIARVKKMKGLFTSENDRRADVVIFQQFRGFRLRVSHMPGILRSGTVP